MRHYEQLGSFERDGFEIVVDKTYEEIDPWSQLSECFPSKYKLYKDIDSGRYEWFMLRVRALLRGHEMAETYLGGCLYERAEDVLTDGTVEDQLITVLREARAEALRLKQELIELDLEAV